MNNLSHIGRLSLTAVIIVKNGEQCQTTTTKILLLCTPTRTTTFTMNKSSSLYYLHCSCGNVATRRSRLRSSLVSRLGRYNNYYYTGQETNF
jgi:hypothetical protein